MSHFAFLQLEWPSVFDAAVKAERNVRVDPRTACFHARRALELAVGWAYTFDPALKKPYQDNLSALVHEPSFKRATGEAVFGKARVIVTLGNLAVHGNRGISGDDAVAAVRELFHVMYWLGRTYGRRQRPAPDLVFDVRALPKAPVRHRSVSPVTVMTMMRGYLFEHSPEPAAGGKYRVQRSPCIFTRRESGAWGLLPAVRGAGTNVFGRLLGTSPQS